MTARRAAVWALPLVLALTGCTGPAEDPASRAAAGTLADVDLPDSADQLSALLVDDVPSGLPRVPDDDLTPPAGAKTAQDLASYADDPDREVQVLDDYGYRFGWERFWGRDGRQTTVFTYQFEQADGAATYTADLAGNDAQHYGGQLHQSPAELPEGCVELLVERPAADLGMAGPAAFAWCNRGVFSLGVTAVSDSLDAAEAEVLAVVVEQLDRLPA